MRRRRGGPLSRATRVLLAIVLGLFAPPAGLAVSGPAWAWLPLLALPPTLALLRVGAAAGGVPLGVLEGATLASGGVWLAAVLAAGLLAHRRAPTRPSPWLLPLVLAAAYLIVGRGLMAASSLVLHRFDVQGISMLPSLGPGHDLYVARGPLRGPIGPGDVVLYQSPAAPDGRPWVKRVVATAGQTVRVTDGVLHVDGASQAVAAPEPVTTFVGQDCVRGETRQHREALGGHTWTAQATGAGPGSDTRAATVPAGHVYVLGDHRDASIDSRRHGPVPLDAVHGRVLGVALSSACGEETTPLYGRP